MFRGMKSVMVFDPKDSQEETERKWLEWNHHKHKSPKTEKHVPTVKEIREKLIK